ncbi:MAG: Holliday junction ATP-dependent helicase ruvA [Gemmatimonadales bacterium]|nr:Holliday junction ATP-dependent helicase ruvA [Gemmatimonadales bacterium]HEV7595734.1 Holliday junction branch migration protein RuvA [Gemmatimonadaceae bacterium]
MIGLIHGKLVAKDLDSLQVMTSGGVGYELTIPLSVYETLPRTGEDVTLHTSLVVKEDSWHLFGFVSVFEKRLFEKLLTANGVGPSLAIGLLSALSATRLIRAIREKDIPTLQSVPRVGRKKAERLILDLGDKLDGLGETTGTSEAPVSAAADDALRALVSLGYSSIDADRGVRAALDAGAPSKSAAELIRAALAKLGGR